MKRRPELDSDVGDCSGRDGATGDCVYLPEYWVAGDPTCHYHLHGCVNRRLLEVGPKVDVERITR